MRLQAGETWRWRTNWWPPAMSITLIRASVGRMAEQLVTMFRTAFPDLQLTVEAQVAEGDMVVSRVPARGTHNGDLMGVAPTGKKVEVTSISMMRMAGGKVAEEWELIDEAGIMRQLGVIPSE